MHPPRLRTLLRSVDDLEDIGNLETYVDQSQCMLIMLTRGYFTSKNCLREIMHSFLCDKPMVLVHEDDLTKGGAPLEVLRLEFEKHVQQQRGFVVGERYQHDKRGACVVQSYDSESGMLAVEYEEPAGEVHRYKPSSQHKLHRLEKHSVDYAATLFERDDIIEWQRVAEYQGLCLRFIAEQLIAQTLAYVGKPRSERRLYLPHAIVNEDLFLPPATRVHVSVHNPGARQFAKELKVHLLAVRTSCVRDDDYETVNAARSSTYRPAPTAQLRSPSLLGGTLLARAEVTVDVPEESGVSSPFSAAMSWLNSRICEDPNQESAAEKSWRAKVVKEAFVTDAEGLRRDAVVPGVVKQDGSQPPPKNTRRVSIGSRKGSMGTQGSGLLTHMLLVLNEKTFQGDEGDELFDEVNAARRNGIDIIMAHECDRRRGGCEFVHFFKTTPQMLISDGLYEKLAISCHAEPYRHLSLSLIAKALGAEKAQKHRLFDHNKRAQQTVDRALAKRKEAWVRRSQHIGSLDRSSILAAEVRRDASGKGMIEDGLPSAAQGEAADTAGQEAEQKVNSHGGD